MSMTYHFLPFLIVYFKALVNASERYFKEENGSLLKKPNHDKVLNLRIMINPWAKFSIMGVFLLIADLFSCPQSVISLASWTLVRTAPMC